MFGWHLHRAAPVSVATFGDRRAYGGRIELVKRCRRPSSSTRRSLSYRIDRAFPKWCPLGIASKR